MNVNSGYAATLDVLYALRTEHQGFCRYCTLRGAPKPASPKLTLIKQQISYDAPVPFSTT